MIEKRSMKLYDHLINMGYTRRQCFTIIGILDNRANERIASRCSLSLKTIVTQREWVYAKFQVNNDNDCIARILEDEHIRQLNSERTPSRKPASYRSKQHGSFENFQSKRVYYQVPSI